MNFLNLAQVCVFIVGVFIVIVWFFIVFIIVFMIWPKTTPKKIRCVNCDEYIEKAYTEVSIDNLHCYCRPCEYCHTPPRGKRGISIAIRSGKKIYRIPWDCPCLENSKHKVDIGNFLAKSLAATKHDCDCVDPELWEMLNYWKHHLDTEEIRSMLIPDKENLYNRICEKLSITWCPQIKRAR